MLVTSFSLANCAKVMGPQDYIKYFDTHRSRFSSTVKRNGVSAVILYMPPEYYAAREMTANKHLALGKVLGKYAGTAYFAVTIASDRYKSGSILLQRDGMEGFGENVMKNSFDRDKDVFLLNGRDTIKAVDYEYERNWGMGNTDAFVFAFARAAAKTEISRYHIIVREIAPELGTVDVALANVMDNPVHLKG